MPNVICVAGHKGGSGKTITAVNLAACLAVYEFKTLLIDLDPRGFASFGLQHENGEPGETIADALDAGNISEAQIHRSLLDSLQFIPADMALDRFAGHHARVSEKEFRLRSMIRDDLGHYDYIVLDTPPRMGWLSLNALIAADRLIVPQPVQVYALKDLAPFILEIDRICGEMNPDLTVSGVLLTGQRNPADAESPLMRKMLEPVKPYLFRTIIPWDSNLQDPLYRGKPLVLDDITSPASMAYMELTREVIALADSGAVFRKEIPENRDAVDTSGKPLDAQKKYARMAVSLAEMIEDINKS